MQSDWRTEEIFLTVKAYPSFSKKYSEACCMAGITRNRHWIRLYPVYFRELDEDQRFAKFTWIKGRVKKSKDFREESHYIESESIEIVEELSVGRGGTKRKTTTWARRNALILEHVRSAAEVFDEQRDLNRNTLAIIKPKEILDLEIDETPDEDLKKQVKNLEDYTRQMSLLPRTVEPLHLIPYSFRYKYVDDAGKVHQQKIVDWEIYQLYRNVRYDEHWRDKIRQKYLHELPQANLHFFVGTMHQHPQSWIIIGTYQPKIDVSQPNMFDS